MEQAPGADKYVRPTEEMFSSDREVRIERAKDLINKHPTLNTPDIAELVSSDFVTEDGVPLDPIAVLRNKIREIHDAIEKTELGPDEVMIEHSNSTRH